MKLFTFFVLFALFACVSSTPHRPFSKLQKQLSETTQIPVQNYTSDSARSLYKILDFVCTNPMIDCAGHGVCISNGTVNFACKCDSGYLTFNCDTNVQCCYKQQPRVKIFLLSFFVGATGAPYFVLGATALGVGILVLCCGGCCLSTIGGILSSKNSKFTIITVIGGLATLAASIWQLALWIQFAASTETVRDSNGVPVAGW